MAKTLPKETDGGPTLEELQQRFESLNTRKIQAGTRLEAAQKQLADLQRQAREQYGTDDVAELRAKLETMKAENDQKRRTYQAQLDKIDADLAAVEQKFAPQPTDAAGK
ncbi:MAG: phage scaffolding protein [Pirellulaceae bacterium]|nr:phage scaffolding protein [Pirellulaceae bacterium]